MGHPLPGVVQREEIWPQPGSRLSCCPCGRSLHGGREKPLPSRRPLTRFLQRCPWRVGSICRLHAHGRARSCTQFQQLQLTHHTHSASHSSKHIVKPAVTSLVRFSSLWESSLRASGILITIGGRSLSPLLTRVTDFGGLWGSEQQLRGRLPGLPDGPAYVDAWGGGTQARDVKAGERL